MADPEEVVSLERRERLRNVLIVAGAYTASALLYKLLFREGLGHTSLLFIGLPGVLAILLALAPQAGTAKGSIVKGITLALLLLAPLVGEGYLCILLASPLFYAIGLAVGAGIDASRRKAATLRCAAVLLVLLSLDGTLLPTHEREEVVTVTRVIPASAMAVHEALGAAPGFTPPLPRFLRLGFPRPVAATGSGLAPGATRTIHFTGAEGDPPGDLTLRVASSSDSEIVFVAQDDTSKLSQWLLWQSSRVRWQPVDATHTRIVWQTTFRRQLDPAWYFGPWERYAVRKATGYLIDTCATPSSLPSGSAR